MKIIYHCYGGNHSSVIAAALHLGILSTDQKNPEAIKNTPFYDQQNSQDLGRIFFLGRDEMENEVYILGRLSFDDLVERITGDLSKIFSIPESEYITVNITPYVNKSMRFGGFISRALGFSRIGRPIVASASIRVIDRIAEVVSRVKEKLLGEGL